MAPRLTIKEAQRPIGRLLNAREVAEEVFGGHVSPEWVRRNVPGKIDLGHSTKVWYEHEVREWVETRREGGLQ